MTGVSKRIAVMLGVGLALVPVLLFAYLGLHNRFLIDDYLYLGFAREVGTWKSLLFWREVWNGDYSNFLLYGLLWRLGTAAPALFALFLCASAFAGFGWLSGVLLAGLGIQANRRARAMVLASLATAATINGFYIAQAFYWLTAAVEYTWPAAMLLLGISLGVEAGRRLRGNAQHVLAAIAAALYAFVNAGFSEMHLVFQLSAMALIAGFLIFSQRGVQRKTYVMLAMAGFIGTFASLLLQLASPGVAFRSSQSVVFDYPALRVRELPLLIERTLELTLQFLGHQTSFAGFMLLVFAGMFLTLTAGNRHPAELKARGASAANAPLAFGLIVQLLFMPILWLHSSDNIQLLGRFSYGFAVAVGINSLAILALLALLWRRALFTAWLNRRNGLMIYCGGLLLLVCLLFAMTQARNNNWRASSYLFVSAAVLLIMLGWQLTAMTAAPRLKRLFLLGAYATASAAITLASLLGVTLWGAGYLFDRTFTAAIFALMLAGLITGLALGALIRHGFLLRGATADWLRWMRLFSFLVAFSIAAGMAVGHGQRISHVRQDIEIWEANHQEVLRLRGEGDPAVYTTSFPRLITDHVGSTPSRYKSGPLLWHQQLYYGLDLCNNTFECRCPMETTDFNLVHEQIACLLADNSGRN